MDQQTIAIHYQRMEEWLNDRKAVLGKKFKKEYNHLLKLAPQLEQLVRYELPAIHKQQKKLLSSLEDSHRAIEEATKTSLTMQEKRVRLLQDYGLTENGVPTEDELDAALDVRITTSAIFLNKELQDFGAAHLTTFLHIYNRSLLEYSMGMYTSDTFSVHFPWLGRVCEECHHALLTEEKPLEKTEQKADDAPCDIDWGDTGAMEPIDAAAAVEIQWDDSAEHVSGAYSTNNDDDDDEVKKLPEKYEGHFSLKMSNAAQRRCIVTELCASRCFALELSAMGDDSLMEFATCANILVNKLTTSMEATFLRMKTSPTLRLSFIEEVTRFQRSITSAATRRTNNETRVLQLQEELERLEPQLLERIEEARRCRDECIASLQKMFEGQPISIVGDISKYI